MPRIYHDDIDFVIRSDNWSVSRGVELKISVLDRYLEPSRVVGDLVTPVGNIAPQANRDLASVVFDLVNFQLIHILRIATRQDSTAIDSGIANRDIKPIALGDKNLVSQWCR